MPVGIVHNPFHGNLLSLVELGSTPHPNADIAGVTLSLFICYLIRLLPRIILVYEGVFS